MAISLHDFILKQQTQQRLDDRQVAELADIDLDVFLKYKHGEVKKMHTATLTKIATVLKSDLSELLLIAGVRRRRSKISSGHVKSPRSDYRTDLEQIDTTVPAHYAELMHSKASQLEEEASQCEMQVQEMIDRAKSLYQRAQLLREKAHSILID